MICVSEIYQSIALVYTYALLVYRSGCCNGGIDPDDLYSLGGIYFFSSGLGSGFGVGSLKVSGFLS